MDNTPLPPSLFDLDTDWLEIECFGSVAMI